MTKAHVSQLGFYFEYDKGGQLLLSALHIEVRVHYPPFAGRQVSFLGMYIWYG